MNKKFFWTKNLETTDRAAVLAVRNSGQAVFAEVKYSQYGEPKLDFFVLDPTLPSAGSGNNA